MLAQVRAGLWCARVAGSANGKDGAEVQHCFATAVHHSQCRFLLQQMHPSPPPTRPTGEERQVVLDRDDGIRPGTTPPSLAQLKPAFKQGGSTTAGNSSQVSISDWGAALTSQSTLLTTLLDILHNLLQCTSPAPPPDERRCGGADADDAQRSRQAGAAGAGRVQKVREGLLVWHGKWCALIHCRFSTCPSAPRLRGTCPFQPSPVLALPILSSFAAVGVPPAILGIGPTVAIPAALEKAGIGPEDVAVYEINEAFASQVSG